MQPMTIGVDEKETNLYGKISGHSTIYVIWRTVMIMGEKKLPQHIVEGKRRNPPRLGCRRRNGKKCMKICGRCFSSNSPFFVLLLFLHCDPKMTPNLWRKKLKVVELGPACFGWWVQAEHTDSGYWSCRSCCSPAGENEAITRRMENELD